MNVLLVMTGGFFGAICRYAAGAGMPAAHGFPLGTLFVNLVGCFVLGWFLTYAARSRKIKPESILFIGTGVIGSFTTFSTFSVETIHLFEEGRAFLALLYILISTAAGLVLADIGRRWALAGEREGDSE